jgi:hypothetical protein
MVAEAMAVPEEQAMAWASVNRQGASAEAVAASLMQLAGDFRGFLPAAPQTVVTVSPAAQHINVQPSAVTVEAPISVGAPTVNVAPPNLQVSLPPGETNIEMPVEINATVLGPKTAVRRIVTERQADGNLVAVVRDETDDKEGQDATQ